jgi:hypothetical protein
MNLTFSEVSGKAAYHVVDGKITSITIGGKPAKPMYMRGLKKAQDTPYFRLHLVSGTFVNPFSGQEFILTPLEATIYDFCITWYQQYSLGGPAYAGAPIQTYDDMKYLLLEINSEVYYGLID